MSSFFQKGQELDESGLKIFITDSNGAEFPALEVFFSIYQVNSQDLTGFLAIPDQQMVAATAGTGIGHWWANWIIPRGQPTGKYQVRWTFREAATEVFKQRRLPFHIVKLPVGTSRTAECNDLTGTIVVVL